jgi:hypothetical protein
MQTGRGYLLPDGFAHEDSLAKAVATARGSDRAIIVYYTRTNCPPCGSLQRRLRKEEVGAPYRDGYVFTAVWGSSMGSYDRESYRTQYWVQGAPTWIFFNRHGKYVCTAAGGFTSDEAGAQLHKTVQFIACDIHRGRVGSAPVMFLRIVEKQTTILLQVTCDGRGSAQPRRQGSRAEGLRWFGVQRVIPPDAGTAPVSPHVGAYSNGNEENVEAHSILYCGSTCRIHRWRMGIHCVRAVPARCPDVRDTTPLP